eukprot:1155283-Pelagomonas_calceolata.AAC.10
MLHAEQKELENFLTHIYRAIASAAPLKDKASKVSACPLTRGWGRGVGFANLRFSWALQLFKARLAGQMLEA